MVMRLTVTQAVRSFSDILARVRFRGERFILIKDGKPVAELGPTTAVFEVRLAELPAIIEALPHLDPNDAERYAQDLDSGRAAAGPTPGIS